jgi:hypothetical protein
MSISYSAIRGHGTGSVTFPSVESWGASMNIMKDPPRSIHTRRKDKVGSTSSITEDIDAATDRAAESIRVYARGSNPAVSVMYTNQGGDGRHMGSGSNNARNFGKTAPSLPYKIMRDGAFRPPVLTQRELMPLSRQPREATSVQGRAGFADWTKSLAVRGEAKDLRQVKNTLMNTSTTGTKGIKRVRPMEAPYEIKYATVDNLAAEAYTNLADRRRQSDNVSTVDSSRYLKKYCLDVGGVTAAVADKKKFKRGVENTVANRAKNVPNFAWERGTVPGKSYNTRNVNMNLKPCTDRGGPCSGYANVGSMPVVHN